MEKTKSTINIKFIDNKGEQVKKLRNVPFTNWKLTAKRLLPRYKEAVYFQHTHK